MLVLNYLLLAVEPPGILDDISRHDGHSAVEGGSL